MGEYIYKNNKKLRCGYTTGTCAAAAAKAAAIMLLSNINSDLSVSCKPQINLEKISIMTPSGKELTLAVEDINRGAEWVSCGVKKDSGDDPDVTNGIMVYAKVCIERERSFYVNRTSCYKLNRVYLDGGIGVGRVTKSGLDCMVGKAAINSVPRKMIADSVLEICDKYNYKGSLAVIISIPEGVEIAKNTFNPRLGIEGGISVLGTSGIVEPMSERAIIESIKLEMRILKESGVKNILVTPGNYGQAFIDSKLIKAEKAFNEELTVGHGGIHVIKCSNFIGDTIDYAVELGFEGVLLVGHIGKFVKLSGGVMNTHSKYADCRMELLSVHAILAGADKKIIEEIMNCVTTDDALSILDREGLKEKTMNGIVNKIDYYIKARSYGKLDIEAIVFSNQAGMIGQTNGAARLLERMQYEK